MGIKRGRVIIKCRTGGSGGKGPGCPYSDDTSTKTTRPPK
jgi:hypothetical protein